MHEGEKKNTSCDTHVRHALVEHVCRHCLEGVAAQLELVPHHAPQGEAHDAGEVHVAGRGGAPFVGAVQLVRRLRGDARKAPHLLGLVVINVQV